MKTANFWVDFCLEAGDEGVVKRFGYSVDLSDEEYEELYQVWYDNNCSLKSWEADWKGHDALEEKLNSIAYDALNQFLKEIDPQFVDPLDAYWEISEETEKAFKTLKNRDPSLRFKRAEG